MTCEVEVAEAANWFGEQLFEPNEQREIFTKRLKVCARPDFGRAHPAPCKVAKAFPPDPPPFAAVLVQELLTARFEGHWYPEEPHRGCAFRSIMSTVNALDPLLLRAAESTGQRGLFDSFNRVFSEVGEVNCWVRAAPPSSAALFFPREHDLVLGRVLAARFPPPGH